MEQELKRLEHRARTAEAMLELLVMANALGNHELIRRTLTNLKDSIDTTAERRH